jgi:hypothetical protein
MRQFFRSAWQQWKVLAEKIGHFQAKVIFGFLYFVLVAPFALGVKIFSDPLQLRPTDHPTWRSFARQTSTLEDARRQF